MSVAKNEKDCAMWMVFTMDFSEVLKLGHCSMTNINIFFAYLDSE